jgi:hypothetical protein
MTTDLQQQIEEQLALAREIEAERKADDEEAFQAKVMEFREKFAPYLEALKAAIPAWAQPYIAVPDDWEPVTISIPGMAPIMAYVERTFRGGNVLFEVRFGLTEWDGYEETFHCTGPAEKRFSLAISAAVKAQQAREAWLNRTIQPTIGEGHPSKWVNLDPTRKAMEAIDAGEYPEAQAFGLIAIARELRTLNAWMATAAAGDAGTYLPDADEPDPDNCGDY